jgi:hypothetical protein
MKKDVSLPKCNLYLIGSGNDANGNKIVKLKFTNSRGFSIQTTGNIPKTGSILRGLKTLKDMENISDSDLLVISKEVCSFIKEYGSDLQKKKLRIY